MPYTCKPPLSALPPWEFNHQTLVNRHHIHSNFCEVNQIQKESRKSVSKLNLKDKLLHLLQVKYFCSFLHKISQLYQFIALWPNCLSHCLPKLIDDSEMRRAISPVQFYTWISFNRIAYLTLEVTQEVCFFHGSALPHLTSTPLLLFMEMEVT